MGAFPIILVSYGLLADNSHKDLDLVTLKAAQDGAPWAQIWVGVHFSRYCKKSGSRDYSEAVRWFRRAAEQGEPIRYYRLGLCYLLSQGVQGNLCEATKWLGMAVKHAKTAHEERNPKGTALLQHFSAISEDRPNGYMVLKMAADQAPGNWRVGEHLEEARKRLKPWEIKTAESMAEVLTNFMEAATP